MMGLQIFRGMFYIKIYPPDGDNENYDYYKMEFGDNKGITYAISKEINVDDRPQIHTDYYQKALENLDRE